MAAVALFIRWRRPDIFVVPFLEKKGGGSYHVALLLSAHCCTTIVLSKQLIQAKNNCLCMTALNHVSLQTI